MEVIIGAICLVAGFLILTACDYGAMKLARESREYTEREKREAKKAKTGDDILTLDK